MTNSHWYCDHHALSSSTVDGTLGVPHCVLSHDCAQELHESKLTLPCISGSREVIKLNISSPENHLKKRDITVEVIQMDQKVATSTILHMKGENALDINIINTMSFFGSEDI